MEVTHPLGDFSYSYIVKNEIVFPSDFKETVLVNEFFAQGFNEVNLKQETLGKLVISLKSYRITFGFVYKYGSCGNVCLNS